MTTDTDTLTERIAHATFEERYPGYSWESAPEYVKEAHRAKYAAVLPIVEAEVRAAQIEAWQEGVNFALPGAETTWYPQHNPYRAAEYETGDQA